LPTDLICPKCQGSMRSYERSGVTVDQCADCRGIFLDRGELEHLVDAEQSWQRQPASRGREGGRETLFPDRFGDRDRDDDDRHGEGHHKRRKRSFFDDLFD